MGLDMLPLPLPNPGSEAEFEMLWASLNARPPPASRFFAKLMRPSPKIQPRDEMIARFQAITTPPYISLNPPVVGVDAAADDWIRAQVAAGNIQLNPADSDPIARFRGYRVLALLPECDGFPVYSNHELNPNLERYAFRGEFLRDCDDLLTKDQISQAWNHMLARALLTYGQTLRDAAKTRAQRLNLFPLIGQRLPPDAIDTPACAIHIADSCGRWCMWWATRGHGLEPDF